MTQETTGSKTVHYTKRFALPVTETVLPNGLTVLTCTVPSKFVEIHVVFRAGSREDLKLGTAHFLEHTLLQGPARTGLHPRLQHLVPKGMKWGGGTGENSTTYWGAAPLESARETISALISMCFDPDLNPQITDGERGPILQEIRQRQHGERYLRWERAVMYPDQKDFHHTPGGTLESVATIQVDDLEAFHQRYYHPENTTLVVSGGMEHQAVLDLVTELGGRTKRDDERVVSRTRLPSPRLTQSIFTDDPNTSGLTLYWPFTQPDPLDALRVKRALFLLTQSPYGSLFQKLRIEQSLVYGFDTNVPGWFGSCIELGCPLPPAQFETLLTEAVRTIRELRSDQINPLAWETMQARAYMDILSGREAMATYTSMAKALSSFALDPHREDVDPNDDVLAMTREDVMRAANLYLDPERFGTIRCIAKRDQVPTTSS